MVDLDWAVTAGGSRKATARIRTKNPVAQNIRFFMECLLCLLMVCLTACCNFQAKTNSRKETPANRPPSRSHALCVSAWHAWIHLCVENSQSRFAAEAPAAVTKILFCSPERQQLPQRSEIAVDSFLNQTKPIHVKPINLFNDCNPSYQM
jgi:hypothetical protein